MELTKKESVALKIAGWFVFADRYLSNREAGLSKSRSLDRAKRGYGRPFSLEK